MPQGEVLGDKNIAGLASGLTHAITLITGNCVFCYQEVLKIVEPTWNFFPNNLGFDDLIRWEVGENRVTSPSLPETLLFFMQMGQFEFPWGHRSAFGVITRYVRHWEFTESRELVG
ncbi:hypothetical protein CRG98_035684 [Punica granatum]|uniref:Uncharacterized protein n=1 Tax=Punica granatum TaxID=22663 RepID=A0A2I0IJH3_PUNGR|nr:hypothetical protein CRG98_035684 [Punica granatum]